MKKLAAFLLTFCVLFGLTACSPKREGTVGDTLKTNWYEFTINYAEVVDEYEGIPADPGFKIIEVEVQLKSIVDERTVMSCGEFELYYGGEEETNEDVYWWEPELEEMMPTRWYLGAKEAKTYVIIYEVPEDAENLTIYHRIDTTQGEQSYKITLGF